MPVPIPTKKIVNTSSFALIEPAIIADPPVRSTRAERSGGLLRDPCPCKESSLSGSVREQGTIRPFLFPEVLERTIQRRRNREPTLEREQARAELSSAQRPRIQVRAAKHPG